MTSLHAWARDRLAGQLTFLVEAHRLCGIQRRSQVVGSERRENTAEHSWHLALLCLVLGEYAPAGVDLGRVLRMVILHDLVEIDAGDTYVYDLAAQAGRLDRERVAAERIFGLLPPDQGPPFSDLWEEFEARQTPDARFAAALDRLAPFLLNLEHHGSSWREHQVTADQVRANLAKVGEGAPELAPFVSAALDGAVAAGWLPER
ncbi:MAG: HD domain-containing protein [Candidatus Dormibacteraeota bacterium]|nr:HD domain-containing protein [Candidatus Dormibacteraeota bacterium]